MGRQSADSYGCCLLRFGHAQNTSEKPSSTAMLFNLDKTSNSSLLSELLWSLVLYQPVNQLSSKHRLEHKQITSLDFAACLEKSPQAKIFSYISDFRYQIDSLVILWARNVCKQKNTTMHPAVGLTLCKPRLDMFNCVSAQFSRLHFKSFSTPVDGFFLRGIHHFT